MPAKQFKIKEITLLTGKDRKSGKTDRFRYPQALHTGRDGWQKSHGISELKTGKTCRCSLRGYVTLRRG